MCKRIPRISLQHHWEHSDCQGKRGGPREQEEQGKSRNDSDKVVSNLELGIFQHFSREFFLLGSWRGMEM